MAVVVKSKNDANETAQKAKYKPTMLGKRGRITWPFTYFL